MTVKQRLRAKSKKQEQSASRQIKPNPGPQEAFLSSPADIVIFGGAAGSGKSYGLLLEAIRNVDKTGYTAVCFRRQATQVTASGGLWDTSFELYPGLGGKDVQTPKAKWTFPSGSTVTFAHLNYNKTVREWDGSQLCTILFDELQHFESEQFWYMLSRNRSTVPGIRACVRASCNPDPDSWLRHFLNWWIDDESGYPIIERSGVIRWMVRFEGELYWADSKEEVLQNFSPDLIAKGEILPMSVTFIPATIDDNPVVLENNPGYKASLSAMFDYEKLRLLGGNWNARANAGELYKRGYWQFIDVLPKKFKYMVRYWDLAGTEPSESNPDPDWTAGALIALDYSDRIYLLDMVRFRGEPKDVMDKVRETAHMDSRMYKNQVEIWLERDPGQAGKSEVWHYKKILMGYSVHDKQKRTNKLTFWRPFAVQVKEGNVYLNPAPWNHAFISEGEGVTDGTQPGHDDQIDAASGGFIVVSSYMQSEQADVMARIGGL